jgi:hypothetical protein
MSEEVNISNTNSHKIFIEDFGKIKLNAGLVPHTSTKGGLFCNLC